MRAAVAAFVIATAAGRARVPVTIRVGLAALQPGDDSPHHILPWADNALYRFKEVGRNQVVEVYRLLSD